MGRCFRNRRPQAIRCGVTGVATVTELFLRPPQDLPLIAPVRIPCPSWETPPFYLAPHRSLGCWSRDSIFQACVSPRAPPGGAPRLLGPPPPLPGTRWAGPSEGGASSRPDGEGRQASRPGRWEVCCVALPPQSLQVAHHAVRPFSHPVAGGRPTRRRSFRDAAPSASAVQGSSRSRRSTGGVLGLPASPGPRVRGLVGSHLCWGLTSPELPSFSEVEWMNCSQNWFVQNGSVFK